MAILRSLRGGVALALCLTAFASFGQAEKFQRTEDVIYGRKDGVALTMDVFQPAHPNGRGLVFVVSGGWFSAKAAINPLFYQIYLDHGYTIFAAVHGSQPKFQIPEIIRDINRAVRFVRHNAAHYGIDPDRIGLSGASAGGHLSLVIATQGGPGNPKAPDPVDAESSAVQCVACFFPPTDFLNYGGPGTNVLGEGILAPYKAAFGALPADPEALRKYGESISPIYSLTAHLPPTLIIQGDADHLVPMQQALSFRDKAVTMGDTVKVVLKPGAAHGWKDYQPDLKACADWFDEYLLGKKQP